MSHLVTYITFEMEIESISCFLINLNVLKILLQSSVMINGLLRQDNGTYTCTAKNIHNTTSADMFVVVQVPTDTVPVKPSSASNMICSKKMLKTHGDRIQPWGTPANASEEWKEDHPTHKLLPDQHNYTITQLKAKKSYDIRVAAVNKIGRGSWNSLHINTPAGGRRKERKRKTDGKLDNWIGNLKDTFKDKVNNQGIIFEFIADFPVGAAF
ncbi:hypothetical protein GQR58_029103 [Nymphon striatum]|nr:hypothetical protein GQR58_029103 [Nymphon striatum]